MSILSNYAILKCIETIGRFVLYFDVNHKISEDDLRNTYNIDKATVFYDKTIEDVHRRLKLLRRKSISRMDEFAIVINGMNSLVTYDMYNNGKNFEDEAILKINGFGHEILVPPPAYSKKMKALCDELKSLADNGAVVYTSNHFDVDHPGIRI